MTDKPMSRTDMIAFLRSIGDEDGARRYEAMSLKPPTARPAVGRYKTLAFSPKAEAKIREAGAALDVTPLYPREELARLAERLKPHSEDDRNEYGAQILRIAKRLNLALLRSAKSKRAGVKRQPGTQEARAKLKELAALADKLTQGIQDLSQDARTMLFGALTAASVDQDSEPSLFVKLDLLRSVDGRLNEPRIIAGDRLGDMLEAVSRLSLMLGEAAIAPGRERARPKRTAENAAMVALHAIWKRAFQIPRPSEAKFVSFAEECLAPVLLRHGADKNLKGLDEYMG